MTDVVDAATRSRMMSGIRGRDTKPEILIRSLLHRLGFRFRINVRKLPGVPDIVLARHNAAVFVHGCFWHGHGCEFFKWPKTRADFWKKKIRRNRQNDRANMTALHAAGWRILVIWECAIRGKDKNPEKVARTIASWIHGRKQFMEITG